MFSTLWINLTGFVRSVFWPVTYSDFNFVFSFAQALESNT